MPVSASAFVKSADFDGTLAEVAAMGLPVPVSIAAMTVLVQAGGSISLITGLFAPVGPPYLWFFLWRHGFWSMPPEVYLPNIAVSAANMGLIGALIATAILTTFQKWFCRKVWQIAESCLTLDTVIQQELKIAGMRTNLMPRTGNCGSCGQLQYTFSVTEAELKDLNPFICLVGFLMGLWFITRQALPCIAERAAQ